MTSSADQPKYWAFISYSHADSKWGKWLHKQLETFPVPRALVGKKTERGYDVPKRLMPIFRDREELPGSATLKDNIQEALEQSRYLVVICSPRSAASIWVNEEVLTFKAMGRSDRVLCLIVDGEPNATDKPGCGLLECFPPAVRHAVNPDRSLSQQREEPIAADARPGKDGKVDALLKLASGLLGVGFDELKQRDARRRRRQKVGYAMAGAAFVALLAWGAWEFQAQRVRLQNAASSMADFREAAATFDSGDSGLGMAYLARALKKDPANRAAAQRLFYELTYKNWVQLVKQVATGSGNVTSVQFNADLSKVALIETDSRKDNPSDLVVVETSSGKLLLKVQGTPDWQPRSVLFLGNQLVAVRASVPAETGFPNAVTLIDTDKGEKLKEFQLEGSAANSVVATEDGKQLFIGWGKTDPPSYWDSELYTFAWSDHAEEVESRDVVDLKSGAIQVWEVGASESPVKRTDWPVVCLSLDERAGNIYAGSIGYEKGINTGYVEELSLTDMHSARNLIKVDAWIFEIQRNAGAEMLVLSCGDGKTRVYGKDKLSEAIVLQSTIANGETQRVLLLDELIGLAGSEGEVRVAMLDGQPLMRGWTHGARHSAIASNHPLNNFLVSWAGITPIDRGGRVVVKDIRRPDDELIPSPIEPPLWWPSQSICMARLSQRADKLFIVRHGPATGGFRWDLLYIDLVNRVAKAENVALKNIKQGSVTKSPSGQYFTFISSGNGVDSPDNILLYDAVERREKRKVAAPAATSAVFFSADEKAIVAISKEAVTFYDLNLRKTGEMPVEKTIYRIGNRDQVSGGIAEDRQPYWLTATAEPSSQAATLAGIVEIDETSDRYSLTLFDTAKARKVASINLPGQPATIALGSDASAVVVAWNHAEATKCALISTSDGAILREFPDNHSPRGFSLDGQRLLMSSFPNDFLYDAQTWTQIAELKGHSRMVCAHAFDPQNRFVATGALDGTVRLWSLENGSHMGEEMPPLAMRQNRPSKVVTSLELNTTGERLLVGFVQTSAGENIDVLSSLSVWDTREQLATLPERSSPFLADAWFVQDGKSLVSVSGNQGGRHVTFLDVSFSDAEVPSAVWKLAEEVSGYDVASQITKADRLPDITKSTVRINKGHAKDMSAFGRWLAWYLSDPKTRSISPFSSIQSAEYRRALVEDMRMQRHLIEAFDMDPKDDLNLANLALLTDYTNASEAMWKVALSTSGQDKDVLFRRAVRLFENSWYADPETARDAGRQLSKLVKNHLEDDLSWSPRKQGVSRNLTIGINRQGLLNLLCYAGSPEVAKQASLISLKADGEVKDEQSRKKYIEEEYTKYVEQTSKFFIPNTEHFNPDVGLSFCASEIRRGFWLDQAGHPLGKELVSLWAEKLPNIFARAVSKDSDFLVDSHSDFALPFWAFAYGCLQTASQGAAQERLKEFAESSGNLASVVALKLLETRCAGSEAEFYAREGLSQRQKAEVTGWPLANSKSLVGAALLQQNRLGEAEPFVTEGAKELVSLKDTVPEEASPRVVEAVDRAKSLYEKTGNQAQASYWSAELENLKKDPRYALLE